MSNFIDCVVKFLPGDRVKPAADTARRINPANAPIVESIAAVITAVVPSLGPLADDLLAPEAIAVMTSKYWGKSGVKLSVQFLDNPNAATKNKILAYANKWSSRCNIKFVESAQGEVRLSRDNTGYWSYIGTDILHASGATLNLQGFTENSPSDAEYDRVVPHEFGHTCGCPHEHARHAILDLLDPQKTVRYFQQTYGWGPLTTKQQVLTPVEESSLMGGPTEQDSVMCYSFPGDCTKSGQPIAGGHGITEGDYRFMATLYPLESPPPPPPPPASGGLVWLDLDKKVVMAPPGWTLQTS